MAGSSTPLRRLGTELRRLRGTTGRTQVDVGEAIGRTHATLVNWERGKTKISKSDLVCLLAELDAPAEVRAELEKLRDEAGRGAGQWAIYGLPDWLRSLVNFEEDAVAITTFEPVIVPDLLQTEEYAHATHVAAPHVVTPSAVTKWVDARMQRQQRLTSPDPLRLHAVICESVLRLEVGGPAGMTAQLEQLLDAANTDNVTIQVLPATQAAHVGVANNFTVLHFADPATDPPLGYFNGPFGGYMISDEGDVASMVTMFDVLRRPALDAAASVEMLAGILGEYRRKGGDHV
ncbi:MAG: helix-turn-helix domain-containing protein [Pseudonocardia sp.]